MVRNSYPNAEIHPEMVVTECAKGPQALPTPALHAAGLSDVNGIFFAFLEVPIALWSGHSRSSSLGQLTFALCLYLTDLALLDINTCMYIHTHIHTPHLLKQQEGSFPWMGQHTVLGFVHPGDRQG